ncbi:pyruvate, water dikinase regulatory protein [Rhodobium gokarnense]|uniref:Putative pyruvate, phosphate dikinase regulatory protein n=1 Tax=Rhodobium gokarnense TaxID=364296 RepID=A0ABT3HE33_9HYPH|nr:pyruvate, water dikinase regulatory protein [Rhodobium gokarnense]MCW2308665.1 regulator of PEP synthase PpsR (kinase-PPPase family) [Rhodobium gokarnense]
MRNNLDYFHLHLVSDSTGETLMTVARAAGVQYRETQPVEHVYPMIRSDRALDRVLVELEHAPGIVLYTVMDLEIAARLENRCLELGLPCVNVLDPVLNVFQNYLNTPLARRVGGQHEMNAEYFDRIEALNFTMAHDDGQIPDNVDSADVVVIGISRTSKTPTSIYLANRGIKATNIPIVPGIPLPPALFEAKKPLIVALIATAERIGQIRQNRLLALNASDANSSYVDRRAIAEEVTYTRRMCAEQGWPLIDVTRRSIEETAAEILSLLSQHRARQHDQ